MVLYSDVESAKEFTIKCQSVLSGGNVNATPTWTGHIPAADGADAGDCQPEESDVAFNSDVERYVTSGVTVELEGACDCEITRNAYRVRRRLYTAKR